MRVRKAVIPAAGLGTRFLPVTKALPKEMLPVVDKPSIQYIVEEALSAGIEDIIIVTGRGKQAIEDHFDQAYELEMELERRGKESLLELVQTSSRYEIHYVRQKRPLGLGHAVYCARKFVGNEPFAVLLGDDIVQSDQPCIGQLIELSEQYNTSVVGVQEVPLEEVQRYGVVAGEQVADRVIRIQDLVEKPAVCDAPSRMAIMGRYVLDATIFTHLEQQQPGAAGEIQLTDALRVLNREYPMIAYEFMGTRYDVGDQVGYLKTVIEFALNRPDLRTELLPVLRQLLERQH